MYVGGGNGSSTMKPRTKKQIAFDNIDTPNITYWNHTTFSPFAVHKSTQSTSSRIMSGADTYIVINGKWGHNTYMPDDGGFVKYDVFKNFNDTNDKTEYDDLPLRESLQLGDVTEYTPDRNKKEVTIGGVVYKRYNEAIHNPPQIGTGNDEATSRTPLLTKTVDDA
jgi:hypothetical protein